MLDISPKNKNINDARIAKKDEFYTQLSDIEAELPYYEKHFHDKTVYCNCDEPKRSNFFRYFVEHFNELGLKKLIASNYVKRDDLFSFGNSEKPFKTVVNEVRDGEDVFENPKNFIEVLKGDGDFRSEECVELLKEADIVVTNPPFSLFRDFIALLMKHQKKFLIIGNINAITCKGIFPFVKENKLWLGASIHSGDRKFHVPDDYPMNAATCGIDEEGKKFIRVKGVRWFTNLKISWQNKKLPLIRHYVPEEYPRYDNYEAIEVSKTADIPCDYDGMMGVPITFLDKYNPEQFEIISIAKRSSGDPSLVTKIYSKEDFPNYSNFNAGSVLRQNGVLKNTYPRILIRKK